MKNNIKGSITIRISEDEMTAYVDYNPSEVLFEWSDEVILDLLHKAGVTKGYKQFHFSRLFKKIAIIEESESFKIAYGLVDLTYTEVMEGK